MSDRTVPFTPMPAVETEYAFMLRGRCYIEPKAGWVISARSRLVAESFPFSEWTDFADNLVPKPSAVRIAQLRASSRRHYPRLLSFRMAWEGNYFHFFDEVLASLRMIDGLSIPGDVPMLVSEEVSRRKYFQEALAAGVFGPRSVIAQPANVIVSTDELYLVKRSGGDIRDYHYFLDRLQTPSCGAEPQERIFLTRSAARGRTLINEADVRVLCARYGFRAVDTDGMSFGEQIALFASARHILGVHSAGLVNVIFARGHALSLIEILPPGETPVGFNVLDGWKTDFEFFSESFGFAYRSIKGFGEGAYYDRALDFAVNTADLEAAILSTLEGRIEAEATR